MAIERLSQLPDPEVFLVQPLSQQSNAESGRRWKSADYLLLTRESVEAAFISDD